MMHLAMRLLIAGAVCAGNQLDAELQLDVGRL